MFAKLLTFCFHLFYIGFFNILSTDAKIHKTPPEVIYSLVGSKVVLSWCISPTVSGRAPIVTFYLENPPDPDITKRIIARVTASGKITTLPAGSSIKHLFSQNDLQVIVSNCTVVGEHQLNYTLVITNLTFNQSRIYKFEANYGVESFGDESETKLMVIDPPTFNVSKSHDEKDINEGNTLTEVCSVVGELPMTVQWLKGDVLVAHGINSSTLVINSTNRTDSGTYTCIATHKLVTIQRWLNVSVLFPAVIKSFGSSKEKSYVGQSVTLSCSFEGNPKPTIRWLTPNHPSGITIPSLENGVNVLRTVFNSSADFGRYTCVVENAVDSDNRTILITQLFSPAKVYFLRNHTTAMHAVTLWWNKTRDNGGSPVTKYKITIHGGSKNIDPQNTSYTRIVINNLEENTNYTFCIRARNVVGFGNKSCINITTSNAGPPEQPTIVVKLLNKNTVQVTWEKVVGEGVTYIVRYREKGATKWDQVSDLSALTYNIKDLKYGITYQIKISAKNIYGEGPESPLKEINIPEAVPTKRPSTSVPVTEDKTPAAKEQSNGDETTVIVISVLAVMLVIVAVLFFVLWFKRRSVRDEQAQPEEVDHRAGPLNGDDYAVVKSTKKNPKKNNDLVYAELSELSPVRDEVKHPSYEPTDYADIAHVLTPNADLYSNVQREEGAYANVEELDKNV